MHMMHCVRNLMLCKKCDEPIPKSEIKDHVVACSGPILEPEPARFSPEENPELSERIKENIPPKEEPNKKEKKLSAPTPKIERKINGLLAYTGPTALTGLEKKSKVGLPICQFCHLEFPDEEVESHQEYCGSRTEQCPECSDFVMLKEWEKHQSMRLYHGTIKSVKNVKVDDM